MVRATDLEIIEGVVQRWAAPSGTRPGVLTVLIDGGSEVELTVWPNRETGSLPAYVEGLNLAGIVGKRIQALAVFSDERYGVPRYRPSQIKIVGGAQPQPQPQPQAQATAQAPAPAPEPAPNGYVPPPREVWSAEGQARGNSRSVGATLIAAYISAANGTLPSAEWVANAAALVNSASKCLLSEVALPDQGNVEDAKDDLDDGLAVISA